MRIDKVYHIYPPSDSKEINTDGKKERSNSKLRASYYLQQSAPSIQPNIAKSEPITDIADNESAHKMKTANFEAQKSFL